MSYMSLSAIKKMTVLESINEGVTTNYDTRKGLNRSESKAPKSIIEAINNSITIEQVETLVGKKFPLYKYKTQITIHGDFGKLDDTNMNRVIVNGNGSVGIKWVAIDSVKIKTIAQKLRAIGIHYSENSSERYFMDYRRKGNTEAHLAEFEAAKAKYKAIALGLQKANAQNLFWGNYSAGVSVCEVYGVTAYLQFSIDAIYEHNIDAFLEAIGCTKEVVAAYETKCLAEENARTAKYLAEKVENQRLAEVQRLAEKPMLDKLMASLVGMETKLLKSNESFLRNAKAGDSFLQFIVGVENIFIYRWDIFLATNRAKKPSATKTRCLSIELALAAKPVINVDAEKLSEFGFNARRGFIFKIK